jgi:hypothetical protein
MCSKTDVEQRLSTSWEVPTTVRRLQVITSEIEQSVPGARTKELMYELVGIVLECAERVHALEVQVTCGGAVETNELRNERIRIELQRDKRAGVTKANHDNYHHDPADVKEWRG